MPTKNVRLALNALEGSNVNAVDSMVSMISLARQPEMQIDAAVGRHQRRQSEPDSFIEQLTGNINHDPLLWIARTARCSADKHGRDRQHPANVSTNGFKRARPVFEDLLVPDASPARVRSLLRPARFRADCSSAQARGQYRRRGSTRRARCNRRVMILIWPLMGRVFCKCCCRMERRPTRVMVLFKRIIRVRLSRLAAIRFSRA